MHWKLRYMQLCKGCRWLYNIPLIVQFVLSEASSDRSTYGHLMVEIKDLMREREFIPQKLIRIKIELSAVWQTIVVQGVHIGPPCVKDFLPLCCNSLTIK